MGMWSRCVSFAACVACGFGANASEPMVKWVFEGASNLYAPPLSADVHPRPGLETSVAARVLSPSFPFS